MTDFRCRTDSGDRRGFVEALGPVPRPAHLLGDRLQVAPREVHANAVAEYVRQRILWLDFSPLFSDGNHHLYLVVKVLGEHRVRECSRCGHDGVGGFRKEEWRLAVRVGSHLARMIGVVAPYAKDAAYGEGGARAGDGYSDSLRGGEDVFGHIGELEDGGCLARTTATPTNNMLRLTFRAGQIRHASWIKLLYSGSRWRKAAQEPIARIAMRGIPSGMSPPLAESVG